MIQVRKRDGQIVPFDLSKIEAAIFKCFNSLSPNSAGNKTKAESLAKQVYCLALTGALGRSKYYEMNGDRLQEIINSGDAIINIETIQDIVVQVLSGAGEIRAVIAYCEYRYQHKLAREQKTAKAFEEKLMAKNVVNQNANVDERSAGGRSGEAGDVYERQYALDHIISKMARENHENNEIYIHDLNKYSVGLHNCLSIPFDDLLAKGFHTRQGDVRPAGSINTAFQLLAVIFQLQSLDQFGGVSATHLDWTMVPYFRKSFMKHYIAAWLKDSPEFYALDLESLMNETHVDLVGIIRSEFDFWVDENKFNFFAETGLEEKDFRLDNKGKLNKKYYQIALYDTLKELAQAVEGMYHNLNIWAA